jgi:hypothetical protein
MAGALAKAGNIRAQKIRLARPVITSVPQDLSGRAPSVPQPAAQTQPHPLNSVEIAVNALYPPRTVTVSQLSHASNLSSQPDYFVSVRRSDCSRGPA